MTQRKISTLCLLAGLVLLPSCEEFGEGVVDPSGAAVVERVSDAAVTGAAGETVTDPLTVRVLDENGAPVAGVPVAWSATGGSVSAAASATDSAGIAQTTWTLAQTTGQIEASATVPALTPVTFTATVTAGEPAEIGVSHDSLTFTSVGTTQQVDVTFIRDQFGNDVTGVSPSWTSGNTAVATVTSTGVVESTGAGSTTLAATAGSAEATVEVTVQQSELSMTVTADLGERGAAADLTVDGPGMTAIEVPMSVTGGTAEAVVDVPFGSDRLFTVRARDSDDVMYAEGSTTTAVEADGAVQVTLSARTEEVTVQAAVPSHATTASVVIAGLAIDTLRAEMTVDTGAASVTLQVPVGASRDFEVTAFDSSGIAVQRGSATAAVTATATVDVTLGAVEGDQPIVATFGDFTLVLSPGETTAAVGATVDYSATVLDHAGNEVVGAEVTWASSNPGIAQVNASGTATALADGTTMIAISYQGFGIAALLTVTPAP